MVADLLLRIESSGRPDLITCTVCGNRAEEGAGLFEAIDMPVGC